MLVGQEKNVLHHICILHLVSLSSAKSEPASLARCLLSLLRLRSGCRGSWLLLLLLRCRLFPTRIVDIIPCYVEEYRLDGDHGQLGRELDNIGEIHAADGILAETLDERRLDGLGQVLSGVFAEVVDVDDGSVALELAAEKVDQERAVVLVHLDVEDPVVGAALGVGELRGGALAELEGVVDEG